MLGSLCQSETTTIESVSRPAVVRVNTDDGNSSSHGSGTCVGWVDEDGLILTAWHVVKDNKGQVTVDFWNERSNLTRLDATVVATNRTWDLAALVVKRSDMDSLPFIEVGKKKPDLGDSLTVAGYGQGGRLSSYREATGAVQGFLSPTAITANDLIMIDAKARSGDSGGPMLSETGVLVGVLFGSDGIGAHGAHCERVRWFLREYVKGQYPKLVSKVLDSYVLYEN